MIIWNLDPVAFGIGPLQVRWYGIVYALGFLLGFYVLRSAAKHKLIPNLTEKLAEDYLLQLMMGSVLMARVFHVLTSWQYYWHHLLEIPAVWRGGLSIFGGLLGAAIVTFYFCRKHRINYYKIADTLVVPLALVLVFGRMANYVNGELWGRKTDVSWCVVFPNADGCRHPSQIYEALYSYVLFFTLLALALSKRFVDGVIFWSFILLYGVLRFFTNFYREFEPGDPALLGVSIQQWMCVGMVVLALSWFFAMSRTHKLTK